MQFFSIAVKDHYPYLLNKVKHDLSLVEDKGIKIDLSITARKGWEIIECNITKGELCRDEKNDILRHHIAVILADFIIDKLTVPLMSQILEHSYYYLSNKEKNEILILLRMDLKKNEWEKFVIQQRTDIIHSIGDFLCSSSYVNIQGFINFRLKTYLHGLKLKLDDTIHSYIMLKEHEEFIELLKYLVDMQPPLYENMHIFPAEKDGFVLMDDKMNQIQVDNKQDLTCEEMLLSGVISSVPRNVISHKGIKHKFPRAIEILQQVFGSHFIFCSSCSFCAHETANTLDSD